MAVLGRYPYTGENWLAPMGNFLLDRGANVDSPPSEVYTSALHAAIRNDHGTIIDRLLGAGADVNAYDPRFETALSATAARNNVDLMKKLFERGANPSLASEKDGQVLLTALLYRMPLISPYINHTTGQRSNARPGATSSGPFDSSLTMVLT
jgi:ankyrin repeat protein